MWNVILSKAGEAVMDMFKQDIKQRLIAMQQQTLYDSAKFVHERLLERIPDTDEYNLYRKLLEVSMIKGMKKQTYGYALRVPSKQRKVRGIDAEKSLLYVKPRRKPSRMKDSIKILANAGPWTADTLPFWPSSKDAKVVVRRVSSREVTKIAKKLKKTKNRTWKRDLIKAGVKMSKMKPLKIPKGAKIIPDLAFQAIRLEFGEGGTKSKPHWRPAVRALVTNYLPTLGESPAYRKVLLSPTSNAWKNWPTRTKTTISTRMAEDYVPFTKRLRIKI